MGGKGKSGPVSTNDQMVQMQMQQAAEAKQANIERSARLEQGLSQITDIFGGHPSDATMLDLSGITSGKVPAIPAGASSTTGTYGNWGGGSPQAWDDATKSWVDVGSSLAGGYTWGSLPSSGGAQQYGIWDSSGNLVTSAGSPDDLAQRQIWYGGTSDKMVGGFDNTMYDKFRQATLDYYLPQETQQYSDARSKLSYDLARAGQLNSSTANTSVAQLAKQDELNRAQIASQADTQTAGLRKQIQDYQQQAINQLYATEDPTTAANTAQNMVANAQLTTPLLNPAGAMFAPIAVGTANLAGALTSPYNFSMAQGNTTTTPIKNPDQGTGITGAV
jgi:hypothetical protein